MYDILIKNGLVLDGTGSPTMQAQDQGADP